MRWPILCGKVKRRLFAVSGRMCRMLCVIASDNFPLNAHCSAAYDMKVFFLLPFTADIQLGVVKPRRLVHVATRRNHLVILCVAVASTISLGSG